MYTEYKYYHIKGKQKKRWIESFQVYWILQFHTLEMFYFDKNDDFSDGGPGLEPVQIKPQRIRIRLTPSKSVIFNKRKSLPHIILSKRCHRCKKKKPQFNNLWYNFLNSRIESFYSWHFFVPIWIMNVISHQIANWVMWRCSTRLQRISR